MAAARELQVQVADEPGALGMISEILGREGINIDGFGVWVATAHLLVSDPDLAHQILRAEGFQVDIVTVLRLVVPNEPGNLAEVARELGQAGINIDYAYTVSSDTPSAAGFILAVANADQAQQLLD